MQIEGSLRNPCTVKINCTRIAVIGGLGNIFGNDVGNKVNILNIVTAEWTQWDDLPYMISNHQCVLTNQGILVAGGFIDYLEITNKAVLIDLATGNNRHVGSMNLPRQAFGMVTKHGKVLAIGGQTQSPVIEETKTIEEYDPDTETWTMSSMELAVPRSYFGIVYVPYSKVCN